MSETEIAVVTEDELSLVDENRLNQKQLQHILQKTPERYIKKRPARGGGEWSYVPGGYVRKVLNLMFGWDWDFEIKDSWIEHGEVTVLGRLTCRVDGKAIVKMQYGNKEIVYRKQKDEQGNKVPLSIGNDKKSAATDALKKCAQDIGIAADVYNPEDFKQLDVIDEPTLDKIKELFEKLEDKIPQDQYLDIQRIIDQKEDRSYNKVYKLLKKIK